MSSPDPHNRRATSPSQGRRNTTRKSGRSGAADTHRPGSFSSLTASASDGVSGTVRQGQDVYFIIPRTVTIVYGPYFYEGLMDYRTERLQGLKTCLEKHGASVVMKQSLDHVNFVRVWFLDEMIFSCRITDLVHGGDGELDPFCAEATEALETFIKAVLRGLREARPLGPEELKKPFCPCFHVDNSKNSKKTQVSTGCGPCCGVQH